MADQTHTAEPGWVKVSNISPTASEEEIKALFGFCGYINALTISQAEDGSKVAIIEFYDKAAVTTAALLTNAIIKERAIKVELYIATHEEQASLAGSSTGPPPTGHVDEVAQQSKTAVMAKLIASGYKLGVDVKEKAIAWDTDKLNLIQKMEALGETVSHQAQEINTKYGLIEKGNAVLHAATEKANELGTTIASTAAYQAAMQKATEFDEKYQISSKASTLYGMAVSKASAFVDETNKEIAKLQPGQPQAGAPHPHTDAATHPQPDGPADAAQQHQEPPTTHSQIPPPTAVPLYSAGPADASQTTASDTPSVTPTNQ